MPASTGPAWGEGSFACVAGRGSVREYLSWFIEEDDGRWGLRRLRRGESEDVRGKRARIDVDVGEKVLSGDRCVWAEV